MRYLKNLSCYQKFTVRIYLADPIAKQRFDIKNYLRVKPRYNLNSTHESTRFVAMFNVAQIFSVALQIFAVVNCKQ